MSQLTEAEHLEFLQGAWNAVLQNEPELFAKSLLRDYVSHDVIGQLPEYTTLANVTLECHNRQAIQESYIKAFMALPKAWTRLTPQSRLGIVQTIQKLGLQKACGKNFSMLEDDDAALTVRWDIAEKLYAAIREGTFKGCSTHGLELLQPRRVPLGDDYGAMLRQGEQALLGLLRERIEIDKTAVTMAVGFVTPVAKTQIMHNLCVAYQECLASFRAALLHWAEFSPHALIPILNVEDGQLSPGQLENMRRRVDESLMRFKREFEQLRAGVENMSAEPTLSPRLRRFFETKVATLH